MNKRKAEQLHPQAPSDARTLDGAGRCITCADEAVQVRVIHIDAATGQALVAHGGISEEVDTTLVDEVRPGDVLLVHGGIALQRVHQA